MCVEINNDLNCMSLKSSRTKFLYSSKVLEKILRAATNQLSALFIGLNESSHHALSKTVLLFQKF